MKKYFFVFVLIVSLIVVTGSVLAFKLEVEVSENLMITHIKPVLEKQNDTDVGTMVVEVTIKNIGNKPAQFIVFASGKEEGGWASGRTILPKDGQLMPQDTIKGKIKTEYEGKELPSIIKIEGFEKMFETW